jgi:hypothetical protein
MLGRATMEMVQNGLATNRGGSRLSILNTAREISQSVRGHLGGLWQWCQALGKQKRGAIKMCPDTARSFPAKASPSA